jgi:hypothetical protein
LNLGNSLLTSTFAKKNPRSGSVGEDVTTNWLAAICTSEESACSRIALDLVCQEHSHVELYVSSDDIEVIQGYLAYLQRHVSTSRGIGSASAAAH